MNLENLDIIFETYAGSHLYGTNTPESDIDYRGICIEPMEAILGLSPFEQLVQLNPEDRTIYGIRKFFRLALDSNPNIIELLYAPIRSIITTGSVWHRVIEYREYFLSTKVARTFVGYAVSQAKRMETHYRWMKDNPPHNPNPGDYGRIIIGDKESWTDYKLKVNYDADLKQYQSYNTWLSNRNPKRHILEEKYGFDCKNALHLVRLLQQGEELLTTGHLTLPRPNASELLDIKNGSMTYEEVMSWMDMKMVEFDTIEANSVLPKKPDFDIIENLLIDIYQRYITG